MPELFNVRYPDWKPQYRAAMLELDHTKLKDRLQAAQIAISERLRMLSQDHFGTPEVRNAIADAVNGLAILEREIKHNAGPSPENDALQDRRVTVLATRPSF
jgi:MoxR-like ATPase